MHPSRLISFVLSTRINIGVLLLILGSLTIQSQAQNFVNPDLNGTISGTSSLPTNWQFVPNTYLHSQATSTNGATPDLTDINGPNANAGISGIPYSGSTFLCGLHLNLGNSYWHEGIMQTVSGFTPNATYSVHFHQSVVKQTNAIDTSGSWAVYIDNTLVGTTTPTVSRTHYNHNNFAWEARSISFTATAASHSIKFLPMDDDPVQDLSTTDSAGGLRMGIDSIYISTCTNGPTVNIGNDTTLCPGDTLTLDAFAANSTYQWKGGATQSTNRVFKPGIYWVDVTRNNCATRDSIEIQFHSFAQSLLGNDTSICQGDTLTLNASLPNASYVWKDGSTNGSIKVHKTGTYWVDITINQCSLRDSIVIQPLQLASNFLGRDTTLCDGDTLTIQPTDPNASYTWQDGSTGNTHRVFQSGSYWANMNVGKCKSSDTVLVQFITLDPVQLGEDTTLCEGDTLILDASAQNSTYSWSDQSTLSTLRVTQSGKFWVKVFSLGCEVNDSIQVDYDQKPNIHLGNDTTICPGDSLLLFAGPNQNDYTWSDQSTKTTMMVADSGVYWVDVRQKKCIATDTIRILHVALPKLNLGNDSVLCNGDTLFLDASADQATYQWQDQSTKSRFAVTQAGTYWTRVRVNQCALSDTISIEMTACRTRLEFPNVFTPNGDGHNDLFSTIGNEGIAEMHTLIYNRWGRLVYETNNPRIEWDGSDMTDGTYFWIVSYTTIFGDSDRLSGYLTLVR
ncbi:gliding motility-associated C-terminal domain-containing protein [bacterium SCSIO 12741]|nr:gliding motility-associated C-terminal domain-containing protein [bacterium SCSIO 12741]